LTEDIKYGVEAYDAYAAALKHDPTNAVALSGISNIIRWRMKGRVHVDGPLQRTAVRYLLRAYESRARAGHYAGRRGVRRVEKLMEEFKIDVNAERPRKEAEPTSPYGAFVRSHCLALCLAPESAGADLKRWDHLSIKSVTGKLSSRSATVPAMFAAWNLLKSDFLAARWLAYVAMKGLVPETGSYSDTLDYGKYGTGQSVLIIAQKATLDVLDKIAAAATDYLGLSGNPRKVYFRSRWHVMDVKERRMFASPLQWQPEVENEICLGNAGLIALSELAYDYAGGYLRSKKEIRDSATHRLIVLHEMLMRDKSNPVDFLERYTEYDFERLLVESLQVARAALFYFHESVTTHERRLRRDIGEVPVLSFPSHHLIRGEDSNIQGLTPEE